MKKVLGLVFCCALFLTGATFPTGSLTDWPPYTEQKVLVKMMAEKNRAALADYVGIGIRLHSKILTYNEAKHSVEVMVTEGPLKGRTATVLLRDTWFMREIAPKSIGRDVWCDCEFTSKIIDGILEFDKGHFN